MIYLPGTQLSMIGRAGAAEKWAIWQADWSRVYVPTSSRIYNFRSHPPNHAPHPTTTRFIEGISPLCYFSTPKTRQTSATLRINKNIRLYHRHGVELGLEFGDERDCVDSRCLGKEVRNVE